VLIDEQIILDTLSLVKYFLFLLKPINKIYNYIFGFFLFFLIELNYFFFFLAFIFVPACLRCNNGFNGT